MDIVTDVYSVEDNSAAMSSPSIYDATPDDTIIEETVKPEIIDTDGEIITPVGSLTDRQLMEAVYEQQQQIGNQLNWLCENLAGVFGMVTAVSQNGGGFRGMMKMMKEMNTNG